LRKARLFPGTKYLSFPSGKPKVCLTFSKKEQKVKVKEIDLKIEKDYKYIIQVGPLFKVVETEYALTPEYNEKTTYPSIWEYFDNLEEAKQYIGIED
jgi:hypothetical protein